MIQISEQAGAALLESLQASGVGPDQGMRLQEQGGQFALDVDRPTDSDHVLTHNEATVLIVDQQLSETLGDAVIDVQVGPSGPQLTIRMSE